ncbi:hypothetical protein H920_19420 [Fukomys damarensis]|uniref:Uncharacterized protein n=1 Tax=Fukomys damarensis TaxID=885580 RepID=A0A091D8V0_FUKDA|nr:hypothetical protein H920_19420 [Fukomys damarensis]
MLEREEMDRGLAQGQPQLELPDLGKESGKPEPDQDHNKSLLWGGSTGLSRNKEGMRAFTKLMVMELIVEGYWPLWQKEEDATYHCFHQIQVYSNLCPFHLEAPEEENFIQ